LTVSIVLFNVRGQRFSGLPALRILAIPISGLFGFSIRSNAPTLTPCDGGSSYFCRYRVGTARPHILADTRIEPGPKSNSRPLTPDTDSQPTGRSD
jgi:hypothetical protein